MPEPSRRAVYAAISLVLTCGLQSCVSDPARPSPDMPASASKSTPESAAAGLGWLLANQRPDGSFGGFESSRTDEVYLDTQSSHRAFHVATTALCAMALVEPAGTNPSAAAALERAVIWSLSEEPVGQATGGTFYDTWAHTYLIELCTRLLEHDPPEPRKAALVELLSREIVIALRRQSADGGWGYYDFEGSFDRASGMQSTSFNTGAMILALQAASTGGAAVPTGPVTAAVERLRKFRLPDGAFIYGTYANYRPMAGFNRPSGSSGRLQVCQLALFRSGVPELGQTELASGLTHLKDRHHYIEIGRGRPIPHEAFYSNSGYYYFFGHYYASRVIAELKDPAKREGFREWLSQLLVTIQNDDGSWFDYPLYGYGKAYATGFAMLTLQQLDSIAQEPSTEDCIRVSSPQNPG